MLTWFWFFFFVLILLEFILVEPAVICETVLIMICFREMFETTQIVVRLGRALRPGEVRGKIHQLCLNDPHERSKFLFEWVLTPDVQIGHIKRDILAEMKSRFAIDIPYEKYISSDSYFFPL